MDKILKIGLIGCGAIGKDHCRRIMETVPGATVVAVSDYGPSAESSTLNSFWTFLALAALCYKRLTTVLPDCCPKIIY